MDEAASSMDYMQPEASTYALDIKRVIDKMD
jgi:hypothetical protein